MMLLLVEHHNVFTWGYKDMPSIYNTVIEHLLCIDPNTRVIRQKRRSFSIKKYAAITEEFNQYW